jgi:hypothetical protein
MMIALVSCVVGCVPAYSPSGLPPTLPIHRTSAMRVRFVIEGSFGPDLERFVDWIVMGNPSVVRRVRDSSTPETVTVQMFASGRPGQLGTCAVVMNAWNEPGDLLAEHTFSHDCGASSGDQPSFVTQTIIMSIEEVAFALHEHEDHASGGREQSPPPATSARDAPVVTAPPQTDTPSPGPRTSRRRQRTAECSTACPRAQRDENGCCR